MQNLIVTNFCQLQIGDLFYYLLCVEFEHPRLRDQREAREKLLAGKQVQNNWSRAEMFEYYHNEGQKKAKTLCPSSLDEQVKVIVEEPQLNGWDYVAKSIFPKR